MSEEVSRGGLKPQAAIDHFNLKAEPLRWFVVAAPGLESVVEEEIRRLPGAEAIVRVEGGVELEGPLEVGLRANLELRAATRVLLRVGAARARDFSKLRRLLSKLPWERWVPSTDPLRISATATRSRLYHTGALAEALALAIGDRLAESGVEMPALAGPAEREEGAAPSSSEVAAAPETRVLLRGVADEWTVSVDSSGELLHRRGWRTEGGVAPLRETLAAGILMLAGYDPTRPLLDPMCGSGTIALEAASLAAGRAPGKGRRFAFERWPGFPAARWRELLEDGTASGEGTAVARIFAWDRDAEAVERARRNAERAGLSEQVQLAQAAFGAGGAVEPLEALAALRQSCAGTPGLVVINPPYGRRLGTSAQAARLVKTIGRTLRAHFPGWRVALLLADARWASSLGLEVTSKITLPSGGLRLTLVVANV